MSKIPASQDVNFTPGVVSGGGNPLSLNAVFLTDGTYPTIGTVPSFPSAAAVLDYFGPGTEYDAAVVYFAGFNNSTKKPGALYFARYPLVAVAGYLLGGSLASMTLTQLQALSGSLTVSIDGTPVTAAAIDLSGATSFSDAATIIETALGTGTVAYSSQHAAFTITSGTTGSGSSVSVATGTLAAGIKLTTATGALTSAGAAPAVPGTFMSGIPDVTQNWATFALLFDPDGGTGSAQKQLFAEWANASGERYLYVEADDDVTATESNVTTSFGAVAKAANWDGVCANYDPTDPVALAAFVCGTIASIDFNSANGRITLKFKGSTQIQPGVTDQTVLNNLIANGYNCYGAYATANQDFEYYAPGQVSGQWKWIDAYVNQIYLTSQMQLALVELVTQVGAIPYNAVGDSLIHDSLVGNPTNAGPILTFLAFGGIQPGIALSGEQAAIVNEQAGTSISQVLSTQGWYLQIGVADSLTRSNRQTPPVKFWYTDGGAVQQIDVASIDVM